MSDRSSVYHCAKCRRDTPRRRLTPTERGLVCPRCLDRLPRNLRKAAREGK